MIAPPPARRLRRRQRLSARPAGGPNHEDEGGRAGSECGSLPSCVGGGVPIPFPALATACACNHCTAVPAPRPRAAAAAGGSTRRRRAAGNGRCRRDRGLGRLPQGEKASFGAQGPMALVQGCSYRETEPGLCLAPGRSSRDSGQAFRPGFAPCRRRRTVRFLRQDPRAPLSTSSR